MIKINKYFIISKFLNFAVHYLFMFVSRITGRAA